MPFGGAGETVRIVANVVIAAVVVTVVIAGKLVESAASVFLEACGLVLARVVADVEAFFVGKTHGACLIELAFLSP